MSIAELRENGPSHAFGSRTMGGVESPFIIDNTAGGSVPDWYQRLLFELSGGELSSPSRNRFLRDAKAAARAVSTFETVRRWTLITRIATQNTGLLALSSARGPALDDFTFALVDLVCELRLADRFDLEMDNTVKRAWDAVKAAAPPEVKGEFRRPAGDPIRLLNACHSMIEDPADDAFADRIIADARKELMLATQYGALNCEERQAVRRHVHDEPVITHPAG